MENGFLGVRYGGLLVIMVIHKWRMLVQWKVVNCYHLNLYEGSGFVLIFTIYTTAVLLHDRGDPMVLVQCYTHPQVQASLSGILKHKINMDWCNGRMGPIYQKRIVRCNNKHNWYIHDFD